MPTNSKHGRFTLPWSQSEKKSNCVSYFTIDPFFKFVSTWISGSTREEVEESFHSNTKWHFVMEGICHFSKHLKRQANVLLTAMVSVPLLLIKDGLEFMSLFFLVFFGRSNIDMAIKS